MSAIPVPPPGRRPLTADGIGVRPGPLNPEGRLLHFTRNFIGDDMFDRR